MAGRSDSSDAAANTSPSDLLFPGGSGQGSGLGAAEALFRAVFDYTPDGVLLLDASELRVALANRSLCRMTGYTPEELVRLKVTDLHPSFALDRVQAEIESLHRSDLDNSISVPMRRKDGTVFEADVSGCRYKFGGRDWIFGLFRDASARRDAEAARNEREYLLTAMGRMAKVGGWEFNAATGEGRWTEEIARIHDLDPSEPTNKALGLSFFPGKSGERITAAVERAIKEAVPYDLELELVSAKGVKKWVRTIGHPVLEDGRVVRLHGAMQDVTESKLAEEALRESEARFRSLIEGAPDAVYVQSDGLFRYVNQAMVRLFGAGNEAELLGHPSIDRIAPASRDKVSELRCSVTADGGPLPLTDLECLRMDGSIIPVEATAVSFRYGEKNGILVFLRDISARKKEEAERAVLQAQFLQAQKMESVGRLAGGVAHDFNNLLMGIMGHAEMCRETLGPDSPAQVHLAAITEAAQRSAGISRQLLAFARKQAISPVVFDLNDHVAGMLKLLRQMIGEGIALTWRPQSLSSRVCMDPSQVDQILANLAVNARDAIDGVGDLVVETADVTLDAAYCEEHAGSSPGPYVMLSVSDTGCGMARSTLDHLFEPFFTTKDAGKGTGLGMATVYGIVKQNNGYIEVLSSVGRGTTIRVYLPWHGKAAPNERETPSVDYPCGNETILLVEDEVAVRATTKAFLTRLGYAVLDVETPELALRVAGGHPGPIHLLLTDVVLPGMSGKDLALRLRPRRAEMRCIFMSGYTADSFGRDGILPAGVDFLPKPVSREQLSKRIREVLDR